VASGQASRIGRPRLDLCCLLLLVLPFTPSINREAWRSTPISRWIAGVQLDGHWLRCRQTSWTRPLAKLHRKDRAGATNSTWQDCP